jgi:hypothetical protein
LKCTDQKGEKALLQGDWKLIGSGVVNAMRRLHKLFRSRERREMSTMRRGDRQMVSVEVEAGTWSLEETIEREKRRGDQFRFEPYRVLLGEKDGERDEIMDASVTV